MSGRANSHTAGDLPENILGLCATQQGHPRRTGLRQRSCDLEDKDIIQVDATVIIGVMILLTLSIGFDSSINAQKEENLTRLMITLAIIAPFTASAVLAILTNMTSKYTEQLKKTSILIMAVGFGYLIFVIAAFMASLYYLI